jgi:hypothetical protein
VYCNLHWFIFIRPLCYFLVPFPLVAFTNLELLYLLLYSEHINHIQVLGFLPFPYSSCAHSPHTVWSIPIILLHIILSEVSQAKEACGLKPFWANSSWDPILKIQHIHTHTQRAGRVTQVVESLLSKHEALNSNTTAKQNKKTQTTQPPQNKTKIKAFL